MASARSHWTRSEWPRATLRSAASYSYVPGVTLISAKRLQALEQAHIRNQLATVPLARRPALQHAAKDAEATSEVAYLVGVVNPGQKPAAASSAADLEGLYDGSSHRVFLVSSTLKSQEQAEDVLSHELDHALDEQHFGAGTIIADPTSDAPLAERAVREGTATLTQLIYAHRYLRKPPVAYALSHARRPPTPKTKIARAGETALAFIYGAGTQFVYALYQRAHGWALVDRALRHPSTTTAQILHPALYVESTGAHNPTATAASFLRKPWHRIATGDVGEVDLAQMIDKTATPAELACASPGWTGARFELWENGLGLFACPPPCRDAATLLITLQWRSPSERVKFAAALPAYAKQDLDARPAADGSWEIPGGGAVSYAGRGRTLTIAFGPSRALAAKIARGALNQAAPS